MSTEFNWDDEFNSLPEDKPKEDAGAAMKELRKKYEAALRELRTRDAELAELNGRLAQSTLTDLFEKFSLPDEARDLYKETKGEPTEEALQAWVTKYGKLFGVEAAPETPETAAKRQAQEKVNEATATAPASEGTVYTSANDVPTDKLAAMDLADVLSLAQKLG